MTKAVCTSKPATKLVRSHGAPNGARGSSSLDAPFRHRTLYRGSDPMTMRDFLELAAARHCGSCRVVVKDKAPSPSDKLMEKPASGLALRCQADRHRRYDIWLDGPQADYFRERQTFWDRWFRAYAEEHPYDGCHFTAYNDARREAMFEEEPYLTALSHVLIDGKQATAVTDYLAKHERVAG